MNETNRSTPETTTPPSLLPPSLPPRESNCSPVNNERCCFIELSLPYWCHFMAPASVPHPARTFSPPFSRTIARIIPGELVERSFLVGLRLFYLSFSLFFFFSFSFSLCDRSKGGRILVDWIEKKYLFGMTSIERGGESWGDFESVSQNFL